ncbi:MAG: hypothetical protein M1515_03075 [Candidatus Thermoplasmatota archaeon]|jgi:hypothetical protein|nr:hypothetical protein [Candidatus Thermoplasmatota archaeon]
MIKMPGERVEKDWLSRLEDELGKKEKQVLKDSSMTTGKKSELNQKILTDLWLTWVRFNKQDIHFTIDPPPNKWLEFTSYPDKFTLRNDFFFETVNNITFRDTAKEIERLGDSLKIVYKKEETESINVIFEYSEGEKYDRYTGWHRYFTQYILYESPLKEVKLEEIENIFLSVMAKWYESQLRRDREVILKEIKENYKKGETFIE